MKKHEVVISGIAGSFPQCKNFKELEKKLFTDENLVTADTTKWKSRDVPYQVGTMKDGMRFDELYFGIHQRLADSLDTHTKHCFEKSFEAIADSGRRPMDFYGSKTAVIMTSGINETEGENMMENKNIDHLLMAYSRCMQSNRVSYAFNFKGPSVTMISGWNVGMSGLAMAYSLVSSGQVRQAVVGNSSITFYPQISRLFNDIGVLNNDGRTKSFSADADGYSRSDAVSVFFLQRAEDALRSYASIVKVMSRTEMDHSNGLVGPTGFSNFLTDFYSDVAVKKSDIALVEGSGNASLKVDAMELEAMAEVLCSERNKPLPVSCCKTKLGHADSGSSFVSISSALIAMKTGYIPPVIHYKSPNPLSPALLDGRIKVVSEKTRLDGDYIAVSSIDMISSFGHILLKRNPKSSPTPSADYFPEDGIPRLFVLSGRDEDRMKSIFNEHISQPVDNGYYSLNHNLFKNEFPRQLFRGFAVKEKNKSYAQVTAYPGGDKRPVWFIFSGMGSQWPEMGTNIIKIPVMRRSIERSQKVLEPHGLDLISIISNSDPSTYDNILHCFVGIAAIQIALVDFLTELGVKPDGLIGHSVGELGCSYADGALTSEQTLLAAYFRGRASNEANLVKGMMAAVGIGYNEIKANLPDGIEVACHNSKTSCTLSGPAALMEEYVGQLKSRGIFARLVNVANIAYHSKNIAPAAPLLLNYLKKIIPTPKLRSSKWISSSVPESKWETDLSLYCSAEYHTNNLLSYVLFEEATKYIPDNAICIEIAPHGLLQAIVKKSLPNCTHIPLTKRATEGCTFTIEAIGLMFNCGIDLDISKIYPKVDFPVARETQYISDTLAWNHSHLYELISSDRDLEKIGHRLRNETSIDLYSHPDQRYNFMHNHRITGLTMYPPGHMMHKIMVQLTKSINSNQKSNIFNFQDLKFFEYLNLDIKTDDKFNLLYQRGIGKIEVTCSKKVFLAGSVNDLNSLPMSFLGHHIMSNDVFHEEMLIDEECIYQFFAEKDCHFSGDFRNIKDIRISDKAFIARIKWSGDDELYIDALFKALTFFYSILNDKLIEIESIGQLIYDSSVVKNGQEIFVFYDAHVNQLVADGVRINNIKTRPVEVFTKKRCSPEIEKRTFEPYSSIQTQCDFLEICVEMVDGLAGNENIYLYGQETCGIFQQIIRSRYFNNLLKAKGNAEVCDWKNLSSNLTNNTSSGCYLVLTDSKLPDYIIDAINSSKQACFIIQLVSQSNTKELTKFKELSPILEKNFDNFKMVFYKKVINVLLDANFIQIPYGFKLEEPDKKNELVDNEKINIFLFKYNTLSDVPQILDENKVYLLMKNVRFVLLDYNSPDFDPTQNFFLLQLKKDIKVSVSQNGVWGSLRNVSLSVPMISDEELVECQLPLNHIRCLSVDLKALAINLNNFVNINKHTKLGVLEYSGINKRFNEEVMGLAKLTADNHLEMDPVLVWKKPENWTMQQAVTVPLFYSMAYYIIKIKYLPEMIPCRKIFIHGSHTLFSQAFINIALKMNSEIYTTCLTEKQKIFITKKYPELDPSKIFVLDKGHVCITDEILESTEGVGLNLVVDCLNDSDVRNSTIECCAENAKYFVVWNDDIVSDSTFGMKVFIKEAAVLGMNPNIFLNMSNEDKKKVVKLLKEGIENGEVIPLDSVVIDGNSSRKAAINSTITSSYKQVDVKKVVVPFDKAEPKSVDGSCKTVSGSVSKKNYLIIGQYNSLWFDMVNWLAYKGADNIYIMVNWEQVPSHTQIRFKIFLRRHSSIGIRFIGLDSMKTSDIFDQTISKFAKFLEKAFCIVPGLEDKMSMIDEALRKHCQDCWLVCIEKYLSGCLTDERVQRGYKAISFVLKKDNLRNRTVINALDHWIKQSVQQNDKAIFIDETAPEESDEANEPDILPKTPEELADLARDISDRPCFNEVSTSSASNEFKRDLDPIFFLPGFKLSKSKKLLSKMAYPAFMARYPKTIKSMDEIAITLSQELKKFSLSMFTLVAEGWAGPLALKVALLLEKQGIISEVILLDAALSTVRNWAKHIKSNSPINRCIRSIIKKEEDISSYDLNKWSDAILDVLYKEDKSSVGSEDEISLGFSCLVSRLGIVENMQIFDQKLNSTIHLFTASKDSILNQQHSIELNQLSNIQSTLHVVDNASSGTLLENRGLLNDLQNLALLEYKLTAKKQNVADISTLNVYDFL